MKRTLLALFLCPALAGAAYAGEPSPPPPPAPHAHERDLPPLPPLPPMQDAHAAGPTAKLDVKGPVTVRLDVISMDVEVAPGPAKQVKAQVLGSQSGVQLVGRGDRVDVNFEASQTGWPHVPAAIDGKLRLEVPPGSNVELTAASADVNVHDVGGNVRLRTASGDVKLKRPNNVEVMAVSGDVVIDGATGEVRLRTVSGGARVTQTSGAASKLEFGTTSGDLDWQGACGSGCRIEARTTSGDVKLALAPSSSFELRYNTHSGDVSDGLKLQPIEKSDRTLRARYGKGEGLVEVQTFSGDLQLARH